MAHTIVMNVWDRPIPNRMGDTNAVSAAYVNWMPTMMKVKRTSSQRVLGLEKGGNIRLQFCASNVQGYILSSHKLFLVEVMSDLKLYEYFSVPCYCILKSESLSQMYLECK